MPFLRDQIIRTVATLIVACALVSLLGLLLWDGLPRLFPHRAHDPLGAVPLVLVAMACPLHALARRAPWSDFAKACILAAAFFFWAANQFWPEHPKAMLFNDVAIVLFVIDVSLAVLGWPARVPK
jgi:hypothetical protein